VNTSQYIIAPTKFYDTIPPDKRAGQKTMKNAEIGLIGGSGVYDMSMLENAEELEIKTPFGAPSDKLIVGDFAGRRVAFLPRHGRHHSINPTEINYRANIWALKSLGVQWILSSSACGSFKEELSPGTMVVIDQLLDRTRARAGENTFFRDGIVAHIAFADPFSPVLRDVLLQAGKAVEARIVDGGTYLNMEGPAFSTRAESHLYKSWGMDVIGMTNLSEAKLAREAEMHYASLALVTDYDSWHPGHDDVDVAMVFKTFKENAATSRKIFARAIELIPTEAPDDDIANALKYAIVTSMDIVPEEVKENLRPIIGRYLG
jgi:5'-methylthioadenosine phosphorylase